MPKFPLGAVSDDRVVFNATTQAWEAGTAGGGGAPPPALDPSLGDAGQRPGTFELGIGAAETITFLASNLDSPTFGLRTNPDSPVLGTVTITTAVVTPGVSPDLDSITITFDSSAGGAFDEYFVEVTNDGGASALVRMLIAGA